VAVLFLDLFCSVLYAEWKNVTLFHLTTRGNCRSSFVVRCSRHLCLYTHAQHNTHTLHRCHLLGSAKAMNVFVSELLNLHRGQGQDILWRDALKCPTEEEYTGMVIDKTGGLFRLAVGLMQSFSVDQEQEPTEGEPPSSSSASPSSASPPSKPSQPLTPFFARTDFTPLMDKLALYFQIRDDLVRDHTKRPFSCVFLVVVC